MAKYYEELYRKKPYPYHPYHDEVKNAIEKLSLGNDCSNIDSAPSEVEIKNAITNKKNRKATTDWKNELIKKGENEMVRVVAPVIKAFWREESVPSQWNMGTITSIWKGRGDREKMENHRGITVSSAIGTIAEEILFNRSFRNPRLEGEKGAQRPTMSLL